MTARTVPLSVRVNHEDAEFLASLEIEGADSPSEKLRALITEAKKRQDVYSGYSESQTELRRLILPLLENIQQFEANEEQYSQILHLALEWIPDAMAELLFYRYKLNGAEDQDSIIQMEKRVTERIFRLIEGFLRLAITQDCEGYDPQVVQKRLPRIQQLMELMRLSEKHSAS